MAKKDDIIPSVKPFEYEVDGVAWKVERPDWLKNEFGIDRESIPEFHVVACKFDRAWQIVRMLHNLNPVVCPLDTDADYLRLFAPWEVEVKLGIGTDKIRTQLDTLRGAWNAHNKAKERLSRDEEIPPEPPPKKERKTVTKLKPEAAAQIAPVVRRRTKKKMDDDEEEIAMPIQLQPLDDPAKQEMLLKYGFTDATFGNSERNVSEALAERDWFIDRLLDLQKLFDEPMVSSIVRMALLNEMSLRRLDAKLCLVDADSPKFRRWQDTKKEIEQSLSNQWTQIKETCPWAVNVENKISFAGVISDVVLAVREYKANKDNRLIDGLFTSFEIQVLMREAVQHDVRYRPGQSAAIVEAISGIWDKNWQRTLPDNVCKQLDAGFKEGCRRVREETSLEAPDLENDGKSGEYPPIFKKQDADTLEIEQPKTNILISEPV